MKINKKCQSDFKTVLLSILIGTVAFVPLIINLKIGANLGVSESLVASLLLVVIFAGMILTIIKVK